MFRVTVTTSNQGKRVVIMRCKGLCATYQAKKNGTASRYGEGQKRCQACDVFIRWDGLFCPCCGSRLRINPRKQEYKIKLRKIKIQDHKNIV